MDTTNTDRPDGLCQFTGEAHYAREHGWQGGWSVRDSLTGSVLALVFDKSASLVIANLLNGYVDPDGLLVYGHLCRGEWPGDSGTTKAGTVGGIPHGSGGAE